MIDPLFATGSGLEENLFLLMMRFLRGLPAPCVQRSLTLVLCEQDSVVCHVVEDQAHCQEKIAMCQRGGSRSGGGRQHLAKGHQRWVRPYITSSMVGGW